jgi:hypothetical protein
MTRAKLTITLKADETVVAEVENPELWQRVLAAIHSESQQILTGTGPSVKETELSALKLSGNSPLDSFAKAIGVSENELVGAMDPSTDAPYLQLNVHCWEAMKRQTPKRGPGAMSPVALSGTLLCLWFREARLGNPTQSQALTVLKAIGAEDKNPSRGVRAAKWLQARIGGVIVLNPAEISTATEIAKSFCLKKWTVETEKNGGR